MEKKHIDEASAAAVSATDAAAAGSDGQQEEGGHIDVHNTESNEPPKKSPGQSKKVRV